MPDLTPPPEPVNLLPTPAAPAAAEPAPAVNVRPGLPRRAVKAVGRFARGLRRLVGTLFVIGLSLLPLSALLAALPAVAPSEAVLSDTVRPARSRGGRLVRRVLAVLAGLAVLVALLAFAIELTSLLPLPAGGPPAAL